MSNGRHYLGAAIGSWAFVEQYVSDKVYWVSCVQKLSVIATVQPYVVYCASLIVLLVSEFMFYTQFLMSLISFNLLSLQIHSCCYWKIC